eukprot:CAMPEP_0170612518 /NCGR_PEP_ID=MMETSP0224-20130122/23768_1 /TAXON_ID=285029 /ORGANISM="Togula jolla, Strain CCCM 725" /LENGTH=362 /DNA_ID=CAMNT_0010938031 /DNA_START=73 /DNA_END=1161 /DNA_ORIENTATION=+
MSSAIHVVLVGAWLLPSLALQVTSSKHVASDCSLRQMVAADLSSAAQHKACAGSEYVKAGHFAVDMLHSTRKMAPHRGNTDKLAVWIASYPRSGSSTMLSMVSAAIEGHEDDRLKQGGTFSLFEPCHDGDVYDDWKSKQGCSSLLWGLSRCDFKGVKNLWGWADPHSSNNHSKFAADVATKMCSASPVVAFKTVDYGHDLKTWNWLLDSHPNMKVLDVVRDPRSIYASWKTTEPFTTLVASGDFYKLTEICENFAKNIRFDDKRVHHIKFEELMASPWNVTNKAYTFLGLPFGDPQEAWISATFNAKDCPEPKPWQQGFTDCHTGAHDAVDKWHEVLSQEELADFNSNEACQLVKTHYGYSD